MKLPHGGTGKVAVAADSVVCVRALIHVFERDLALTCTCMILGTRDVTPVSSYELIVACGVVV